MKTEVETILSELLYFYRLPTLAQSVSICLNRSNRGWGKRFGLFIRRLLLTPNIS